MTIKEIIQAKDGVTDTHNSMGCSENWYNSAYCIANTFSEEELNGMSENEINNLVRLAENIGEHLY